MEPAPSTLSDDLWSGDVSSPSGSTGERRHIAHPSLIRRIASLALELLIVLGGLYLYIDFQRTAHVPGYQEQDPDGYFWMAKRMAEGSPLTMAEANPFQWQTHVWVEPTPGQIVPKYPPGYPLLLAFFIKCFGEDSAFYASTVMGAFTVLGAYWLFRQWLRPVVGILATATFTLSPMFLGYSAYPLTHSLDMCLVTWALAFLWYGMRHARTIGFLAAALLLGLAVPVRPTNLVLAALLPVAAWRAGIGRRGWLGMGIAYLPGPYIFASYNWLVFGSPFRSGYDLSGEQVAFSWPAIAEHLPGFLSGLNHEALPIIFPLGLIGILAWGTIRERLIRALVFVPLLLVYCSYYWPYCGMASLRFLLIAFPVLVGSAFGLIHAIPFKRPITRLIVTLTLCAIAITVSQKRALNIGRTLRGHDGGRILAQAIQACDEHLMNDAVIFSIAPVFCHLGSHRQYDFYNLDSFRPNHIVRSTDPREPRMQPSRRERLAQMYESMNEQDLNKALQDLVEQQVAAKRQVVFLIPKDWGRNFASRFSGHITLDEVHSWREKLPDRDGRRWGIYQVVKDSGR